MLQVEQKNGRCFFLAGSPSKHSFNQYKHDVVNCDMFLVVTIGYVKFIIVKVPKNMFYFLVPMKKWVPRPASELFSEFSKGGRKPVYSRCSSMETNSVLRKITNTSIISISTYGGVSTK